MTQFKRKHPTMKPFLATLTAMAALHLGATEFYTNVTNDWLQGRQTNALARAEQRLAINTNDLPALVVKASYDYDFGDAAAVSNSLTRLLTLGKNVSAPAFASRFPVLQMMGEITLATVATEDPVKALADQAKVSGPGHFPRFYFALRALEESNLIAEPLQ